MAAAAAPPLGGELRFLLP
uniref:Uncharacterized protein n=1 Tax=Arundo donax TaxID=35708 RepID=A0A0A9GWL0_ARUDO